MTKNPTWSCADEKTPMSLTRQGNVFQIPYSTFVMSLWLCFPLQNTVTRLSFPSSSSVLFSLSSHSSVRSFQISTPLSSSLAVKTCRCQLWRDKGRDVDGFSRQHSQPSRRAASQCSRGKQQLISSPGFLL